MELATVQVRMDNLKIEADIAVGSRGNPTVTNAFRNMAEVRCFNSPILNVTHLPCLRVGLTHADPFECDPSLCNCVHAIVFVGERGRT